MCELNVFLLRGDERERIMDSVAKIIVEGGSIKEINFSRGEAIILAN